MKNIKSVLLVIVFIPLCTCSCAKKRSCCPADFVHDLCYSHSSSTCYCDNACTLHGDCCDDYTKYCLQSRPEPCIYTEWEAWGACSASNTCDIGFKTRRRSVKQFGNFKSSIKCHKSELVETTKCGDLDCFKYNMSRIYDSSAYLENHYYYSAAMYQFKKGSGNCDIFQPEATYGCIMCPNDSKCGENVIKKGDEIDINIDNCKGKWAKRTKSYFRTQCISRSFDTKIYAFNI